MTDCWEKDTTKCRIICDNPIMIFNVMREERTQRLEVPLFFFQQWKYLIIKCALVEPQPSCFLPTPLFLCAQGDQVRSFFYNAAFT